MSRNHSFVRLANATLSLDSYACLISGNRRRLSFAITCRATSTKIVAVGLGGAQFGCDLKEFGKRGSEVGWVVAEDVGRPCGGVCRRQRGLRVEDGIVRGVALAVLHVAVGTIAVGGFEKNLPGSSGVRIICSVPAGDVGISPLGSDPRDQHARPFRCRGRRRRGWCRDPR